MNLKELHSFKISDALYFHDELNPVIFNGDKMDDDVRERLLEIAKDFLEHLGINDLDIEDVTLSGSNAAYSYTRHSDIDVHILVDMKKFKDDDVYRELFDAKKIVYNDQHNIKIGGYDVEMYVQDTSQPVISLGEYSILHDKWIRLPRKRKADLDQAAAKLKFEKLAKLAEYAYKSGSYEKIQNVLRVIKKYRQAGLDLNGEFGPENIAYKALRSQKVIEKLYDRLNDLHSERLSLPEDAEVLNVHTLTPIELAKLHKTSRGNILKELSKGIKIEMEHTQNYQIAKEIALDHLKEDPRYYTKLATVGLEEDVNQYVYHVTPTKNLKSIAKQGLVPTVGDRTSQIAGEKSGIYVFPDKVSAEDAVMNWLGDEFDDEPLTMLKINISGLENNITKGADYELIVGTTIEPKRIKKVNIQLEESSGYIPSEKEKNDPRFKTALSVDVGPDAIVKNAKAFGFKTSRAGIPPLLR
jgi:hypothetical protein